MTKKNTEKNMSRVNKKLQQFQFPKKNIKEKNTSLTVLCEYGIL